MPLVYPVLGSFRAIVATDLVPVVVSLVTGPEPEARHTAVRAAPTGGAAAGGGA